MPATRATRKATNKKPYTTPGPTSSYDDVPTPDNGKTVSPDKHPPTKRPNAKVKKGPSPAADNEEAGEHRGKAGQALKAGRPNAQAKATRPSRALPIRASRTAHPAGQPKIRRSKEQIAADREAELKALKEKVHAVQMAKERLAQMNIMEEHEEDDLHPRQPSSTTTHKRRHTDVETDSDECFDLREVGHGSDSDSSSEPDKAAETKTKGNKRIKGAARQELLTRTEELRSAKHVEKSRRQKQVKCDIGRFTGPHHANSGLRSRSLTPPSAAQLQQPEATDTFELGGLCDDDLEDTCPAIVEVKGLQCNPSRGNELVRIGENTEDIHLGKLQAACKASQSLPKSKAAKATVKRPALHKRQESVKPLVGSCPEIAQQCLNDSRWISVFLPTLSHALYVSDHPFTNWTRESSTLVETVQHVFDLSFTNISYTLNLQDMVVKAGYDRMKTRRSKIASEVLTLVKTFFDGAEFKKRPEKIKEYVRWALRSGGPAYYETPVPKSCTLRLNDPGCVKPDGFLRSQFILPVAKTHMNFAAKSVLHPSLGPRNPPKGLYAMILTAVERAMRAHMTGVFNAPGDFNHRTTWNSMKDFYRIIDQVRESHWVQALNFNNNDTENRDADDSLLSAYRVEYYLPSSPAKPEAL